MMRPSGVALGILLSWPGASLAGVINLCHEAEFRLVDAGQNEVLESRLFRSDRTTPLQGTIEPGVYGVSLRHGAAAGASFGEAPDYCAIRTSLRFSLSQTPPADPGEDSGTHQAITRVAAYQISTQSDSDTASGFGQFGYFKSSVAKRNNQRATSVHRVRTVILGNQPSEVSLDGQVIAHAQNDFMAGFPGPHASAESFVVWRFHVIATTNWTLDVDVDVEDEPGNSATLPILPVSAPGPEEEGPQLFLMIDDQEYVLVLAEPNLVLQLDADDGLVLDVQFDEVAPGGSVDSYEVSAGDSVLGTFAVGERVDFAALTGGGVSSFRFRPIGAGLPEAIPHVLQLGLDATSDLTVQTVPESAALLQTLVAFVALRAASAHRRRRSASPHPAR